MYSWDNAQVVLVGNKCDLEEERVVTADRGRKLAERLGINHMSRGFSCCHVVVVNLLTIFVFTPRCGYITRCC